MCSVCVSGYLQLTRGGACIYLPGALSSCEDGVRNGNEEGVDCGGPNCVECVAVKPAEMSLVVIGVGGAAGVVGIVLAVVVFRHWYRRRLAVVVPVKPSTTGTAATPKRVTFANSRRLVLGKQHSDKRRASSTVTPIVNVDWSQQESRQPSHAGRRNSMKAAVI